MFFSEPESVDPISLPEMIDFVSSLGRWDTEEKIADSVEPLRRLGANSNVLMQDLAIGLFNEVAKDQVTNFVTNSFILYSNNGISIRLNIWRPLKPSARFNAYNGRIYAYGYPHDHDFDLLTVGAYGPGYTTSIYEYEPSKEEIFIGDSVQSSFKGDFTLSRGSVLFYEQSKDIHIQKESSAFSASLNLLASQRLERQVGQFIFDPLCEHIVGTPEYRGSRLLRIVESLLEMDEDNIELIRELSRHYKDDFVGRNVVRIVSQRYGISHEEAAERVGVDGRLADGMHPDIVVDVDKMVMDV